MLRFANDAWFAGFVDGEGCFSLDAGLRPRLSIALRADDGTLLNQLQRTFGGSVSARSGRGTINPQFQLCIAGKADLEHLVGYFDRFPLRAKKARDYEIWREAVLVYCAVGRRAGREELVALKTALCEGRAFRREAAA